MPGCQQPIATRVWGIIVLSLVIRSYLYCAGSILLPVYHLSFVLQVKIAILQYLQGLIGLMDPSDFTNSGGILSKYLPSIKNDLSRGFNKHRRPTTHVGYFAHRGRLLFYRKKKQLDLFSERPTGFTLCFSHVNAVFQSFFQKFLTGLRAKVRNLVFIICSLLEWIDCVTGNLKATFSWMKNTLFCPQIWSPELLGLWNFKIFWGGTRLNPPPPPLEKGTSGPLLVQSVTLSKPLATSIFIETPAYLAPLSL